MAPTAPNTHSARQQFEPLFRSTYRRAQGLAFAITRDECDAEDVVQEAYARAWQHFAQFDCGQGFEPWLLTIVRNCALDVLRRRRRITCLSLDSPQPRTGHARPYYRELPDSTADPEQILLAGMLDERVEAGLLALSSQFRESVLLCDVEQWTYEEIAERMHCSVGTVRSRIHRGRRMVRESVLAGNSPAERLKTPRRARTSPNEPATPRPSSGQPQLPRTRTLAATL